MQGKTTLFYLYHDIVKSITLLVLIHKEELTEETRYLDFLKKTNITSLNKLK